MDKFNETFNKKNTPFLLFIGVYLGFQIFAQIWGTFINTGIPANKNYIQNFVAALVLIFLVIYYGNPQIDLKNPYNIIFFVATFIFVFLYCYAKKSMDDMSEKEKLQGKNRSIKVLTMVIIFLYAGLAFTYLTFYLKREDSGWVRGKILGTTVIIAALITGFYFFKNNKDEQNNVVLSLYLYPLLFLTSGLEESRFLQYSYTILYTTVIALWGFFGVEWFTGKKEYEGINTQTCKAYLGISDDQLTSPLTPQTQTAINTRNINFIYIAMGLIFTTFVVALIFVFVTVQKLRG